MGRVRFGDRDRVRSIFLDNNVDPGSTKDVDLGTCLTCQNHDDPRVHGEHHGLELGTAKLCSSKH